MGAVERALDLVERLFGGGPADLGPRAGAEALGDLEAELDAGIGSEALSACASVLATMNSTPWTSERIMLAMALPPAPPTPMTLILGRSSSTSGRTKSMLMD